VKGEIQLRIADDPSKLAEIPTHCERHPDMFSSRLRCETINSDLHVQNESLSLGSAEEPTDGREGNLAEMNSQSTGEFQNLINQNQPKPQHQS
jgi:hypothetical protein